MTHNRYVPFHRPSIGEEEIAEVFDTLKSGWLTTGKKTQQFEAEFQAMVGSNHTLAVNSCTAGLHLALAALGIGPGDEVITTPMTFCATVSTIMHTGATPVLADIGPDGNIDVASIEERITPRTKAILPVHYAGLPCEMDRIWNLAERHNLYVVEDAAHAVGAAYRGVPIGSGSSDAVAFSFYATKNMTTGEGGIVTAKDPQVVERMRRLCLHGISRDAWQRYGDRGKWFYEVTECGFKYNLSDIQAALGIHQLRKLEQFNEIRRRLADAYDAAFAGLEEVETLPLPEDRLHARHLYPLRLNLDRLAIDRDAFADALVARSIGISVHFIPVPLHGFFARYADLPHNQCPNALALYPRLISLPLYPSMTEEDLAQVIQAVTDLLRKHRTRKSWPAAASLAS